MLVHVHVERRSGRALHEQLIGQLRDLVLRGELPPGTRLPSSREAARELDVSRNVVVLAYEQLVLEGYLQARVGSGTRVPESLPAHLLRPRARRGSLGGGGAGEARGPGESAPQRVRLSSQGERLAASRAVPIRCGGRPGPFLPGVVAPEHFPVRTWTRLSSQVWRRRVSELVRYGDPAGYGPLREAIADHVRTYRAVRCAPEQVLVTSGSQQALDLIARLLVEPGHAVALEEPGYRGAQVAFAAAGARLMPVPVDRDGIVFPDGVAQPDEVRVLYATPSHQYPLGVTLTLARRLRLLEWARRAGAWIVEDDYDSEFRYASRPLPSLQGLDPEGRVIYVGTLSKVLAPGLRLGFLVLPPLLVEAFRAARVVADSHSPLVLQATLAEFMTGGHLERHIARLRPVYEERRRALRTALESALGGAVDIPTGAAGLHLAALLPDGADDRRISELAAERGIEAPALSDYALAAPARRGLVLGYAAVSPERIPGAVDVVAEAVRTALAESGGRADAPA